MNFYLKYIYFLTNTVTYHLMIEPLVTSTTILSSNITYIKEIILIKVHLRKETSLKLFNDLSN